MSYINVFFAVEMKNVQSNLDQRNAAQSHRNYPKTSPEIFAHNDYLRIKYSYYNYITYRAKIKYFF